MKQKIKRIGIIVLEEMALLSGELLLVLLFGTLAIVGFANMVYRLVNNHLQSFDDTYYGYVHSFLSDSMTSFMKIMTSLGNPQVAIIPGALIVIYFLFIKPHRWYSILVPVVGIGSFFINRFMKYFFDRPRPLISERMVKVIYELSFPSGHAMFSMAFYGLVAYISWHYIKNKTLKVLLTMFIVILIFFIGVSRVYLRVHYPSDVLAGFAAGFIWLVIAIYTIKGIEHFIKRREQRKSVES
jgi:membrane-associated phospholipid phosphatase